MGITGRSASPPAGRIRSGKAMNPLSNPAAAVQSGSRKQSLAGVRLRKHADYQRAYAASRKRQSSSMSWFLAPQPAEALLPGPRIGLTVGKVLGKAHERNRIKRRLRDILRRHVDLLPPQADLILHPRRTVLTMEFAKLEAEVVRILTQARSETARPQAQEAAPSARTAS